MLKRGARTVPCAQATSCSSYHILLINEKKSRILRVLTIVYNATLFSIRNSKY
jgi:hypothetical protein